MTSQSAFLIKLALNFVQWSLKECIKEWNIFSEELLQTSVAHWWSPGGSYILYARFDDANVPKYSYPVYGRGDNVYGSMETVAYPKVFISLIHWSFIWSAQVPIPSYNTLMVRVANILLEVIFWHVVYIKKTKLFWFFSFKSTSFVGPTNQNHLYTYLVLTMTSCKRRHISYML